MLLFERTLWRKKIVTFLARVAHESLRRNRSECERNFSSYNFFCEHSFNLYIRSRSHDNKIIFFHMNPFMYPREDIFKKEPSSTWVSYWKIYFYRTEIAFFPLKFYARVFGNVFSSYKGSLMYYMLLKNADNTINGSMFEQIIWAIFIIRPSWNHYRPAGVSLYSRDFQFLIFF